MVEQIKFELGDENEIIFRYAGQSGAKSECRSPRKKRTPEQMAKANQRNKSNRVRRTIALNFTERDLWNTLKYPKGTKKSIEELKADWQKFVRKLRSKYKKAGYQLKFIYRMEIGSGGGLHIHFLCNRIPDADIYIDECWQGRTWHSNIYAEGGYEQLADYITKPPSKDIKGQLSLFPEENRADLIKYGCSRNLKKPEDVMTKKTYSHWTMRAFLEGESPKPSKGFVVDKSSVYFGVNPFTGLSYLTYREYRVRKSNKTDTQGFYRHFKERKEPWHIESQYI